MGPNANRSIETPRVHDAARRRGSRLAARLARATAGDAANWCPVAKLSGRRRAQHQSVSPGIVAISATSRDRTSRSSIGFAEGVLERLTSLTAELVALNSSVIVVGSTSGIVSTRKVTQTVPLITIGTTDDPVRLGLAENFARPGRNVTGFLLVADQEIVGKRLQLLRDAAPGILRVGIIMNPDSPGDAAEVRILPSGDLLSPSPPAEKATARQD